MGNEVYMTASQAIETLERMYREYMKVFGNKDEYKVALIKAIAALGFMEAYVRESEKIRLAVRQT